MTIENKIKDLDSHETSEEMLSTKEAREIVESSKFPFGEIIIKESGDLEMLMDGERLKKSF